MTRNFGWVMRHGIKQYLFLAVLAAFGGVFSFFAFSQDDITSKWQKRMKEYPPSSKAIELSEVLSFGDSEDGENFLWSPRIMALDSEDNNYVIDSKLYCLFKFDSKGRFVAKTGRQGQGPGEFQIPVCMALQDKRIYVCDNGKFEIMIFDLDLKYSGSIKVRKAYISLAITSQGLICAVPLRTMKTDPLINVLDGEGNLIRAFGEGYFGTDKRWQVHNFSYIDITPKDEIYLAFQLYPTVCKFDLSGKLLARFEIDSKYMKNAGKQNENELRNADSNITHPAVRGMRALDDGFCLLQGYPYTGILEFDGRGRLIGEYWSAKSYDYFESDFAIKKTSQTSIYVLTSGPKARVEVFQPKK